LKEWEWWEVGKKKRWRLHQDTKTRMVRMMMMMESLCGNKKNNEKKIENNTKEKSNFPDGFPINLWFIVLLGVEADMKFV
jgi:hypothetical protein